MGVDSSSIIMNRKRKTQKYQNLRLPLSTSRPSLKYCALASPSSLSLDAMVRAVIQDFVTAAERIISLRERGSAKVKAWLETVEGEQGRYIELATPHTSPDIVCEVQPISANPPLPPFSHPTQEDTFRLPQSIKSRELDASVEADQLGTMESHLQRWQQARRCQRNDFVSLRPHLRTSEEEDRSQEIQQLLRRKKQLLNGSKCAARVHTQISRTFSTNVRERERERERRHFWQDDAGEASEIVPKSIKILKEPVSLLKLQHIRVLPGQQQMGSMLIKKKPIVDLVTARRRKRRGVGDTCVLVEQLRELDTSAQDLGDLIEGSCQPAKGVKMVVKERRMTTIVRLPTLR